MKRAPWLLGGVDPMQDRRGLADGAEELARAARRSHPRGVPDVRPPLLLLAAGAIDSLVADSTDVEADLIDHAELVRAAERANIDVGAMSAAEGEELRGFVSAVRGAAGEQWVTERLVSGELPVPDGTVTAVLHDFGVPGVDLTFHDGVGALIGAANVKIAGTADVVTEHLDRYADVVPIVYASSDAVTGAARMGVTVLEAGEQWDANTGPVVVDIGAPSTRFTDELTGALSAGVAEASVLDEIPWFSAGMVGIRAMRRLQAGASLAVASRAAGEDSIRSGAAVVAGRVVGELGLAAPVTAAAAVAAGWAAHGALEVRRSWKDAARADTLLAELADQISEGCAAPGQ